MKHSILILAFSGMLVSARVSAQAVIPPSTDTTRLSGDTGQPKPEKCPKISLPAGLTSFLKRVSVRQSFQDKPGKKEAASIAYTAPKDKDANWVLQGAIGIDLIRTEKDGVPIIRKTTVLLDPFVEYSRNTVTTKEQKNLQTGIALEWQTTAFRGGSKRWSPIFLSAPRYNNNYVDGVESVQANIHLSYIQKKVPLGSETDALYALKYFLIPNHPVYLLKGYVEFEYTPFVGLESESRIQAKRDSAEGNVYRTLFRVMPILSFFPRCPNAQGRIEITADYQLRHNLRSTTVDIIPVKQEFFTSSLNYYIYKPNEKSSVKIGLDYARGRNPTKGFESQDYYALTLKVML